MRSNHLATRVGIVLLLFLVYPWAVVTLQRIIPGPAMLIGVVPVAATAALFGIYVGIAAVVIAAVVDNVIARNLDVIARDLLPWASLLSLAAELVLVISIGALRGLWRRVGKVNQALAEANGALAEEASLRSAMAAELQANAELYSSLLNSMVEGVGLFDHEDRFVFANAAAEQLFAAGPLVGKCLCDFIEPEGLAALDAARRGPTRGGAAYKLVTRLEGTERRQLLVTETVLSTTTNASASVLRVMHDVTVRERLEWEQRELAGQMQRSQAMQSLGVLAGGVAHDFNNLLTGVLGHADLALLRLGKATPPEEMRSSLVEIQEFAREAAALAKQMLAYAGKGTLVTEVLRIGDVAGEALRLLQSTVAARAALSQSITPLLPNVRGDRTQLRQIIVNLVMNAVESLGEQRGTVRLTIDFQHIDSNARGRLWKPAPPNAGKYVVLTVSDNGQGMSEDTVSRIFEPYFSTKVAGRGMGLAATEGIVRAHGGCIGVDSIVGVGSTFRVLLPPDPDSAMVALSRVAPEQPTRGQGVVLLIDDERAVRSTASLMLEALGYQTRTARSGREGLELLAGASTSVRLVLLDLTMPEMDGRDTLSEMRRAGHAVPVLLISGYHHGEVAPLLREPGVVGFLQKPLQLDQLARAVREALDEQRLTAAPQIAALPNQ